MANCPNCGAPVADHPENGCVLAVLVQVVRERGNLREPDLQRLHLHADVDVLWNRLGPILDALESGEFNETN